MAADGVIELTQHIAFPPARVWDAVTDAAIVAKWWAPGDVKPEVGHKFTLDMGGFGQTACTVLEVEPLKKFSYTFGEGMLNTTITWTLVEAGDGTDLTLTHAGFDTATPMGQQALAGMGAGWPSILGKIEGAIAGE